MPFPLSLTDARGRRLTLTQPPRRIVSLVPSQTELLAHLGLDEAVVGLTRFCVHPADWKRRKSIVGGTKQINVGRLRALQPDLVLANVEENTPEMVETLDTFAPVYVTDVGDVPGALTMIRTVGRLTARAAEADALADAINAAFGTLRAFAPVRAAYLIWQKPYMTVGHDTLIHDVMRRAGLVNVFSAQTRYPEVTPADLVAARPGVVLLASEPFPFREKHAAALRAILPETPLRLVDGELFSWYGSRLLQTPAYLAWLRDELDAARTAAP